MKESRRAGDSSALPCGFRHYKKLTTYAIPLEKLTQRSVAALPTKMNSPDQRIRETLPGRIVERESVRRIEG